MEHLTIISKIMADLPPFGKIKPRKHKTEYNTLAQLINSIGAKYEPNFKVGENQKELYTNLCYYFTNNPACIWDLSKGLFLHGKKGVGKSLCMKIFKQIYLQNNYHCLLSPEKSFTVFNMETLSVGEGREQFYNYLNRNLFCDEVFRETKSEDKIINNYGTKEQPFSVGVHSMYRNYCDNGKLFHFSTNYWSVENATTKYFNGEVFSQVYGAEITDRIIEMCNIIEVKNEVNGKSESLRK